MRSSDLGLATPRGPVGAEQADSVTFAVQRCEETRIHLKRSDGSIITQYLPPFVSKLNQFISHSKWNPAIRLCRLVKVDKVEHLAHIKQLPSKEARLAELQLLCGDLTEAENILSQAGLHASLIALNLRVFNWEKLVSLFYIND
ncbi:Intraflagellar transport protein 80 [Cichlidogyrus casuarinus]|uniref:Intraflagellar transport protein 80 n=1 Tax=Cichlidogyrus casuarinus TaxID=1844966 RepID=A0ABD2QI14_9PLAT